jgi:hypothetical protein
MTRNLIMSVRGSRNGEIPVYPGRLVDWVMDYEGLVRVGYKGLPAQEWQVCPGVLATLFFKKVSFRSLEIRNITEGFDRIVAFLVAGIGINPCKEPLADFEINSIPGTGHHRPVGTFGVE